MLAKDGTDLPAHQVRRQSGTLAFAPGEIYDVKVTPRAAGPMTPMFLNRKAGPELKPAPVPIAVR